MTGLGSDYSIHRVRRLGPTSASLACMTTMMPRFCHAALLSAALILPLAMTPTTLRAQDRQTTTTTVRTYHDTKYNDDHQWNSSEDQAYRAYNTENHRKTVEFSRLRPADQQTYWGWRHEHSDAQLKIDIK
jgi:hypothetical protein